MGMRQKRVRAESFWSGSWSGGECTLERDWRGRKTWMEYWSGGNISIAKRCFWLFLLERTLDGGVGT